MARRVVDRHGIVHERRGGAWQEKRAWGGKVRERRDLHAKATGRSASGSPLYRNPDPAEERRKAKKREEEERRQTRKRDEEQRRKAKRREEEDRRKARRRDEEQRRKAKAREDEQRRVRTRQADRRRAEDERRRQRRPGSSGCSVVGLVGFALLIVAVAVIVAHGGLAR